MIFRSDDWDMVYRAADEDDLPANQQGLPDYARWEEGLGSESDSEVPATPVIDLTQPSSKRARPGKAPLHPLPGDSDYESEEEVKEVVVISSDDDQPEPKKAKHSKDSRHQDWVFTFNNPGKLDVKRMKKLLEDEATYAVFQGEVGKNGTPHLQGFFQLPKPGKMFKTLMNLFKKARLTGIHLEVRRGTVKQADEYPKKDETYAPQVAERWSFGEINYRDQQGKRSDIAEVHKAIKEGADKFQIQDKFPSAYMRMRANIIGTIREQKERIQRTGHKLIILFGSAGAGKSHMAKELVAGALGEGEDYGSISPDFSDYMQYGAPRVVVAEEFKGNVPLNIFKRIFDRKDLRPPIHQRYENQRYVAELTILTSNYHPRAWYDLTTKPEEAFAIYRRIDECYHFKGVYGSEDNPPVITKLDCGKPYLPAWWSDEAL